MTSTASAPYKQSDKKWESLLKISEEAHSATSIENFVATVHAILADLVLARNFFICLFDESSQKYFFPYFEDEFDSIETVGVNAGYEESLNTTLYDLSGTLTDQVRKTGLPIRFPNEEMNQLYASGEIELFGSQSSSWLGVPLRLSGDTIGVMVVQVYGRPDAYSVEDEELLVFVSDHIARAIENVRAEEKFRKQHQLVIRHQQAMTDSLSYAKRIQKAVLPSPDYIGHILPEYFTVYKPKDIVSGDFYWVREIDGFKVVVVADCTGHGVPGALMSMLGVSVLNEQFRTVGIQEPGKILGSLRTRVKEILAHEETNGDHKDGIDMAMVIIDPKDRELQFAGANRPLYLFRRKGPMAGEESDYELHILKGDKQPIGAHWEETAFSNQVIKLESNDTMYMFSDGYVDQYGWKNRKKFKPVNFRNLLLSVQSESMEIQQRILVDTFNNWRGSHEQIDDVCVFGLRVCVPDPETT